MVRGNIGCEAREFLVGVGEGAHAKHQFLARETVTSEALPVANPRLETVEFYKVSDLKVTKCEVEEEGPPPPWLGIPPLLRSTGNAAIGDWRHEPKRRNARAACGDAGWRSR